MVEDLENNKWLVTTVYGPTNYQCRNDFWRELDATRARWSGAWCLGGDFNVIRFSEEKLGRCHLTQEIDFSDWINSLLDLQLHGASFTWSNQQVPLGMSRLDRFLICGDWAEALSKLFIN